ncbi:MAG: hypothetical protein FJ267_06075 [Planctomycetes bacterium]|nr:hypothetical protein [Planctomycetota bacterium]
MTTPELKPDLPVSSEPIPKVIPVRRRRWVTWLLLLAIFAAGVVTGGGLTTVVVRRAIFNFVHHPEKIPDRLVPMLKQSLKLDDEQLQRVNSIVRQRHQKLLQIRQESIPRIQSELDQLDQELSDVLNEDQKRKWKSRFGHVRQMWFPMSSAVDELKPAE